MLGRAAEDADAMLVLDSDSAVDEMDVDRLNLVRELREIDAVKLDMAPSVFDLASVPVGRSTDLPRSLAVAMSMLFLCLCWRPLELTPGGIFSLL